MDMDGAFEDTSAKLPAEARDIILSRFYLDCTQRATISMCDRGEHDVKNRAVRYGTAGCRQGQCGGRGSRRCGGMEPQREQLTKRARAMRQRRGEEG